MNKAPSKEEILGRIEHHVENMDKYLMTRTRKLVSTLPFVFLGISTVVILLLLFVLAMLKATHASLFVALFISLLALPIVGGVVSIYSDSLVNEEELKKFKKKFAVSAKRHQETKPFLQKSFPGIQKNNIGFSWYSKMDRMLKELDDYLPSLEEPEDSLENILFDQNVVQIEQPKKVVVQESKLSVWKI